MYFQGNNVGGKFIYSAVNTVSSIYGPALVYQVMFSSVAICLMTFQVADVSILRI